MKKIKNILKTIKEAYNYSKDKYATFKHKLDKLSDKYPRISLGIKLVLYWSIFICIYLFLIKIAEKIAEKLFD